ncbi:hypothetical protein BFS14_19555 [Serratia fonticola]|uniref:hypothetical protein n=1 Tax=Serratia fonticola TaxID=47917 RepID=UPI0008FCE69E|nr:hypothetical protein [Serratia fonticola]OIX93115.1 hypothetical protein BFS14_19555 [Serratia fonticola]QCR63049.1 hypothetical protein FD644_23110 [Serratia fonticola]
MKQAAHIKEVREPGDVPALSALGFPAMPLQWIENMSRPEGLRFLSGTTGSGGRGARGNPLPAANVVFSDGCVVGGTDETVC